MCLDCFHGLRNGLNTVNWRGANAVTTDTEGESTDADRRHAQLS